MVRWRPAMRRGATQAKLAGNLLNDPPLTLLLEAQAAQLGGDEKAATRYFAPCSASGGIVPRPARPAHAGAQGRQRQRGPAAGAPGGDRAATDELAASTLLDLELRSGDWPQAEATLKGLRSSRSSSPPTPSARAPCC